MKERSIKERMDRSFTVHGIYVKKALEFDGPLEGSLHYLLPIRSSLVILDVLKDRMITDITHTWQEFHDHAMDSYLEDIRRQFGTDPLDKKNAG